MACLIKYTLRFVAHFSHPLFLVLIVIAIISCSVDCCKSPWLSLFVSHNMILLVHPLSLVVTHHPSSLLSWWRLFCPSSTNWFLWSSLMSLVSHLSNWLLRNILCPPSSNWLWQNIPLAPHLSRTRQGRRCRSIGSYGDRRRVCILAVALQFSAMHSARRASIFVIDDKMSAVGSSCVVRHDVPLERTNDVGGKFCKWV